MRQVAMSGLVLVSLTAGCGESDDKKKVEDDVDPVSASNGNNDGNGGVLPDEDDEDLDNACDYDPCCLGNDEYEYERCNPKLDAGMLDSSVPDAATSDAGTDAGVDAGADAGADASADASADADAGKTE